LPRRLNLRFGVGDLAALVDAPSSRADAQVALRLFRGVGFRRARITILPRTRLPLVDGYIRLHLLFFTGRNGAAFNCCLTFCAFFPRRWRGLLLRFGRILFSATQTLAALLHPRACRRHFIRCGARVLRTAAGQRRTCGALLLLPPRHFVEEDIGFGLRSRGGQALGQLLL
jgi:hypothetical protein